MSQDKVIRKAPEISSLYPEMTERQKLAVAYRIVHYLGWCETIYGHLTLRTKEIKNSFLINRCFGY